LKVFRQSKIEQLIDFDNSFSEKHCVIGTDEAGRGPLAGPVSACALYFPNFNKETLEILKYLDDSKKFSSNPNLRKALATDLKEIAKFKIAWATVEEIEKYNILQCSLLAMKKACNELIKELKPTNEVIILVDGKFIIKDFDVKQSAIIKGDSKSASIAAASIIAKVERDELMIKLSEEFPVYKWSKNKGYPTKDHINAIKTHGDCEWHRKTFLTKIHQKKLFETENF
jgi:ribonuclease HII